MRLHVWTDFTTAGSSNFDCNNARCIRCVDLRQVALPTARHLVVAALPCFLLSRYLRAATLLWISQARKWFSSLWSLKSKSAVISTWLSKESALPVVFGDFSGARGERPPPRYDCWRLLASPTRNQTFASYLSLKLSVLPLHADLP